MSGPTRSIERERAVVVATCAGGARRRHEPPGARIAVGGQLSRPLEGG